MIDKKCFYNPEIEDHLLDRVIVINEVHKHKISTFLLAKNSVQFNKQLKNLRRLETSHISLKEIKPLVKEPIEINSVDEIPKKNFAVKYDNLFGIETALSFIHMKKPINLLENFTKLRITHENLELVLKTAKDFDMTGLLDACKNYICHHLNPISCWKFYEAMSREYPKDPTLNEIKQYMATEFLSLVNCNDFLKMRIGCLQEFLRLDELNIESEFLLVDAIVKWIDHQYEKRLVHTKRLFECLRLGYVSKNELSIISNLRCLRQKAEECKNILALTDILQKNDAPIKPLHTDPKLWEYIFQPRVPNEAIFVIGGWEGVQNQPNFGPSKAIQVYNFWLDSWIRYDNDTLCLNEGHAYSGCVSLNNVIYIIGGYISTGPTQETQSLDLLTMKWNLRSPMHEKRNYVSACTLRGLIYAVGGHNGRDRLNSVEIFNPETNTWVFTSPMLQVRSDASAESFQDRIYVCGGFDGLQFYATVECYNPDTKEWVRISPMHTVRSGVSLIGFQNHLYALGGNDGHSRLNSVERYDPDSNQWTRMESMILPRSNFCVSRLKNEIYVMGGWSDHTNSTVSMVERWRPKFASKWQPVQNLFLPASANCCCIVGEINKIRKQLGI